MIVLCCVCLLFDCSGLAYSAAQYVDVRAVLNNSFGFGGTNASLIMKAV